MQRHQLSKRRALLNSCATIITLLLATTLQAQTIAGVWQGTLPNPDGRIVLKLTSANDASIQGALTLIDRGSDSIQIPVITFTKPDLRFEIFNVTYHGKLNPDGKIITGTWTRNKQSTPLNLTLATPETLWANTNPATPTPMTATDPAFEVATIKPTQPGASNPASRPNPHIFTSRTTVAGLVRFAYSVQLRQIDGGPSWINDLRFDVMGEPDAPGVPSADQQRLMVKKLLAERFNLKLHTAQREFPVYALTVDKNPTKLKPADPDAHGHLNIYAQDKDDGNIAMQFDFATMPDFADMLMSFIPDCQIIDETNLTGQVNFAITVPGNTMRNGQGPDIMDRPTAFILGVQQLGLKLVPKKATLEVLVIDNLDKPSEN
jgi:uncharacterized protein (TIGR03435 family)